MKDWFSVSWKYDGVEHSIVGMPALLIILSLFLVFGLGVLSLVSVAAHLIGGA